MKKFLIILFCISGITVSAQNAVKLELKDNYLNFPVSNNEEVDTRLELVVDGRIVREFDIMLADTETEFWVFLDISPFKDKSATLRTYSGESRKGLEKVYQSNDRSYLDNVYEEKHRPQLHFSTMRGWINDPNGLIYYDGEYHLFYQHNPYGWDWGNMHWGHAVSKDLVHWEQVPIALYPDENGVCFSGCAVIDEDNTAGFGEDAMVALYTSVAEHQTQSIAYSLDQGRTWSKYAGNPVIGERIEEAGSPEVRDPNVFWHEQTSKWVMILFENMGHSIFTSDNLKDWQYESHFNAYHECPELFELPVDGDTNNTKWVTYGAKGHYSIGSFDGKVFTPELGQFSYIAGEFYAAQTFYNIPEEDGRRLQIGWATIETPEMPFNMMMGFPTELTLRTTANGIRLFNEPVFEMEKLHISDQKFTNLTWQQANEKLSAVDADLLHLKMTLDPIAAGYFELRLGGDLLNYEWYQNKFNYGEKEFTYNRELDRKALTLEIIVDRTSLEVFVDEGAFTLVLPRNLESDKKGISLELDPEFNMIVKNLEIYEMKSIWE